MLDFNIGVNNINQLEVLKKFDIKKIFCGYIDDFASSRWHEDFLVLNRRGKGSSLCGKEDFQKFAVEAKKQGIDVYVTFNGLYSPEQYDWIVEAINFVSSFMSVKGIIVNDIGLLLRLKQINYNKHIVISTGGTTFNSSTVSFYKQFGTNNIILDRQLKIEEIISILENHKDVHFEIFLLFANCTFVDGYCSLLHQLNNSNDYGPVNCGYINYLRCFNKYKIIGTTENKRKYNIKFYNNDDYPLIGCNLCIIKELIKYSKQITYKLVTRSNYIHEFEAVVKQLHIIQNLDTNEFDIKELFELIFKQKCDDNFGCYISPLIV